MADYGTDWGAVIGEGLSGFTETRKTQVANKLAQDELNLKKKELKLKEEKQRMEFEETLSQLANLPQEGAEAVPARIAGPVQAGAAMFNSPFTDKISGLEYTGKMEGVGAPRPSLAPERAPSAPRLTVGESAALPQLKAPTGMPPLSMRLTTPAVPARAATLETPLTEEQRAAIRAGRAGAIPPGVGIPRKVTAGVGAGVGAPKMMTITPLDEATAASARKFFGVNADAGVPLQVPAGAYNKWAGSDVKSKTDEINLLMKKAKLAGTLTPKEQKQGQMAVLKIKTSKEYYRFDDDAKATLQGLEDFYASPVESKAPAAPSAETNIDVIKKYGNPVNTGTANGKRVGKFADGIIRYLDTGEIVK